MIKDTESFQTALAPADSARVLAGRADSASALVMWDAGWRRQQDG